MLVVGEIALALVLLAGAGLLVRSLAQVWRVDPGFDPRQVLIVDVALAPDAAGEATRMRRMFNRLLDGLQHVPGADSAAVLAGNLPLTGESDINFWREDRPRPVPPAESAQRDLVRAHCGVCPSHGHSAASRAVLH